MSIKAGSVPKLFRFILTKLQKEENTNGGVIMWLRCLLALHFATVVKDCRHDLSSLAQIQGFLKKKTRHLDQLCLLKGKLDMTCLIMEAKKPFNGINHKKQPLIEIVDESDHASEAEGEEEEDEDDEEIKEIELRVSKRAKIEASGEEDEESGADNGMQLDDSVSDDGDFQGEPEAAEEDNYSDLAESDEAEQQMQLVADSSDEDREEEGKGSSSS